MSKTALFDTTMALARRIREATGHDVRIGPPLRSEMGSAQVALTLIRIQPNATLRNTPVFRTPPSGGAAPARVTAIALDLHYLITCMPAPAPGDAASAEPGELDSLGQIIGALHADARLTGSLLPGQDVRLSPESYSLDDMSRVWSLFPGEPFRTSIVYVAAPVYIGPGDTPAAAPGTPLDEHADR